jgi:xanthine dehydrogenase accessory factor
VLNFYQQFASELAKQSVVLATVTRIMGSVPREVGAKMLVCADRRIVGTIGGGAGEAKVYSQALEVLRSGIKTFVEIDLTGAPNRETQGVCGGRMQVWLERWDQTSLEFVTQILDRLQSGQAGAIVTPFDRAKTPSLSFTPTNTIQVTATELIEPLPFPPTLLIIGAGHVAVPLAQVAHLAGFQIVVVDDRPEFACPDRFPMALVIAQPIPLALGSLPNHAQLYAALVTRGFQHDLDALKTLLNRPTHYIGMIGSQKRVRLVIQTLIEKGHSATSLEKIHAPIGLDIGALTPEEIAVSICAELIQIRRGGTGRSLSNQNHQSRNC